MTEAQVTNITEDLLRVNIPSLSYWGLIEICTNSPLQKFWYQEKSNCYIDSAISNRQKYFELTDQLVRLANNYSLVELTPLAKLVQLEFVIETRDWPAFLVRLNQNDCPELKNISGKLNEITGSAIPLIETVAQALFNQTESTLSDIKLLDIDHSIENKIIFYHLLQSKSESIEKIAEKIDLMTLEQKENFIEHICHPGAITKVPKIILSKPFCTFKINAALSELLPLVTKNLFKIFVKRPCYPALTQVSENLTASNYWPEIIKTLDQVKNLFDQTQNYYLLPLGIKQLFLMDLDLQSLFELSRIENPLKTKIINLINKEAPFTKGITNT